MLPVITRLRRRLARFFSTGPDDQPAPSAGTAIEPEPQAPDLLVWLDGEPVVSLVGLYYDQPVYVYRLTPLTDDHSKVSCALDDTLHREECFRVVLQSPETGDLMADSCFFSHLSWEKNEVRLRIFGVFHPPPRAAFPDDVVAGFGSWTEAQCLLRKADEEWEDYLQKQEAEKAAAAQRRLPRPAMPPSQDATRLPVPATDDAQSGS